MDTDIVLELAHSLDQINQDTDQNQGLDQHLE